MRLWLLMQECFCSVGYHSSHSTSSTQPASDTTCSRWPLPPHPPLHYDLAVTTSPLPPDLPLHNHLFHPSSTTCSTITSSTSPPPAVPPLHYHLAVTTLPLPPDLPLHYHLFYLSISTCSTFPLPPLSPLYHHLFHPSTTISPLPPRHYHLFHLSTTTSSISPLRPVPDVQRLSLRSDPLLVLRLARLHQQFPQSSHLHHLQRWVSPRLQASSLHFVQVEIQCVNMQGRIQCPAY